MTEKAISVNRLVVTYLMTEKAISVNRLVAVMHWVPAIHLNSS